MSWQPQNAGTYQIMATFEGSKSYYGSTATTYLTVNEAPETPPITETEQPTDSIPCIIGVGVAMIIAIATILLLRKR